jgi:hypothetical protein
MALAGVGIVSIIVNVLLTWSAHRSASAANAAVAVERDQLAKFDVQLKLMQQQLDDARGAAGPRVQVWIESVGPQFTEGKVLHAFGTEPASEIEIWIRGRFNEGGAWACAIRSCLFLRLVGSSATSRCPRPIKSRNGVLSRSSSKTPHHRPPSAITLAGPGSESTRRSRSFLAFRASS